MPRLLWPSWRWTTTSGTRSRAISTAPDQPSCRFASTATVRGVGAVALGLLSRHGDAEAFLGGDLVVEVFGGVGDVNLYPFDGAVEVAGRDRVIVADG